MDCAEAGRLCGRGNGDARRGGCRARRDHVPARRWRGGEFPRQSKPRIVGKTLRADRRPLLHAGPDFEIERRDHLLRSRHHYTRDARPVEYAGVISLDPLAARGGMAFAAKVGCGMKLGGLILLYALAAHATTYCVTIAGLGGEPDYEQHFAQWANEIDKTLKGGGSDVKSEVLTGANATKANLQAKLGAIAKDAKPADAIVVMMIGHGSFDNVEYKIELPGPDVS